MKLHLTEGIIKLTEASGTLKIECLMPLGYAVVSTETVEYLIVALEDWVEAQKEKDNQEEEMHDAGIE